MRRILQVLAACVFVTLGPQLAHAQSFAGGLAKLASEESELLKAGIEELALVGDAKALPVLYAFRDGALRVDPASSTILIERAGELTRAADGKVAPRPASLRSVVLSNSLRRALQFALARLELSSPAAAVRRGAAKELLNRASPELGPVLRKAWKSERDPETKSLLALAVAQADVRSTNPEERLQAVKILDAENAL